MNTTIDIKGLEAEAYHLHDTKVNQKYNGYPFSLHLKAVKANCTRFKHLLADTLTYHKARAVVALHDSIEDARLTYNELIQFIQPFIKGENKREVAMEVADSVFLLTEYRGKTRHERHPDVYFTDLRNDNLARYAKLCDIGANRMFSLLMGQMKMYEKYVNEFPRVEELTKVSPSGSMVDPFTEMYEWIKTI